MNRSRKTTFASSILNSILSLRNCSLGILSIHSTTFCKQTCVDSFYTWAAAMCTKHCLGPGSPVANIWWWQQSASSLPLCTQTIAPISEPHFFPSTSTQFLIPPNRWNLTDLSETRENVTPILLFSTIWKSSRFRKVGRELMRTIIFYLSEI